MDFVCPKCRREMFIDGNTKRCASGHSYDRARAGYYNLLLGSSGGIHGDNRDMVEARRRFLEGGYYFPLARRLSELVCEYADASLAVLDCGCGEGYYTYVVSKALADKGVAQSQILAFDISRDAARLAARRCGNVSVAVASSYDIPLPDGSVSVALNVFSPLAQDEVHRVLALGGKYIVAYPAEEHLYELKAAIYDAPYKNNPHTDAVSGFSLKVREKITYSIDLLTSDTVRDLFMMTPYAYRTGKRELERLDAIQNITTRVEFLIDVYEKI